MPFVLGRILESTFVNKRKKDKLAEFANMTELLAEEIKKIKRALSKKPQAKNTKHINFKKLFPLLKYGKVKR